MKRTPDDLTGCKYFVTSCLFIDGGWKTVRLDCSFLSSPPAAATWSRPPSRRGAVHLERAYCFVICRVKKWVCKRAVWISRRVIWIFPPSHLVSPPILAQLPERGSAIVSLSLHLYTTAWPLRCTTQKASTPALSSDARILTFRYIASLPKSTTNWTAPPHSSQHSPQQSTHT